MYVIMDNDENTIYVNVISLDNLLGVGDKDHDDAGNHEDD